MPLLLLTGISLVMVVLFMVPSAMVLYVQLFLVRSVLLVARFAVVMGVTAGGEVHLPPPVQIGFSCKFRF